MNDYSWLFVQAKRIIERIKKQYPGCENAKACFESTPSYNMGNARDSLAAIAGYGPQAIQAIAQTTPYTSQQQYLADKQTAPEYAALQNQIYSQYGPQANAIGNQLA